MTSLVSLVSWKCFANAINGAKPVPPPTQITLLLSFLPLCNLSLISNAAPVGSPRLTSSPTLR